MTVSVPRDQIVDADDNVIVDNVLIEFDYEKYAADCFSAYQKAKAELTSSP